jgi:DUF1365 family protein
MTDGATLQTCFYEGTVVHRRRRPVEHEFKYRLSLVCLDLAEADRLLGRRGLWSSRPWSVQRFRRDDHLGDPDRPLDECVRDLVEERLGFRPTGPIRLLTNFRCLGFQMNPVSFHYCYGSDGGLEALVAEVTNTPWNERHDYVVDLRNSAEGRPRTPKEFHVSPFMGMDKEYRWSVGEPGRTVGLRIESFDGGGLLFDAAIALRRREWTTANRCRALLLHPFATMQIAAKIYWQALRLWLKNVPYVPHPAAAVGAPTREVR